MLIKLRTLKLLTPVFGAIESNTYTTFLSYSMISKTQWLLEYAEYTCKVI